MSEDEFIVLIATVVLGAWLWAPWARLCLAPADFGRRLPPRQLAVVAPAIAGAFLLIVLRGYASHDVRDSATYLFFYTAMGACWLGATTRLTGLLGLSLRDDWLERRNPAAALAGTGFLLGATAAFAGGNIGDGPGWWVVVFCALLSTLALGVAWWIYARLSDAMDRITVERDTGAGLRLAGFLFAVGVVTGRSVAGNWKDLPSTVSDFVDLAWPVLPYAILAGLIESRIVRSTRPAAGSVNLGLLAAHVATAAAFLIWAGPWS